MKTNVKAIALTQSEARTDAQNMGLTGTMLLALVLLFAAGIAQANGLQTTDLGGCVAAPTFCP